MSLFNDTKRLRAQVSPRRRWQLLALVCLMLAGAAAEIATLGAVVPFLGLLANPSLANQYPLLGQMAAAVGIDGANLLVAAGLLFSLIAVVAAGVRMLLMWATYRLSYGLGADLGGEVYRRTLYQPYAWHVSHNTSEILSGVQKVNAVTNMIVQFLQGGVALVMTLAILGMLLSIDFDTAMLAGTGFALMYGLTTWITRRRVRQNSRLIAQNETNRMQAVQEGLGGIRDVLLDGAQPLYHRRFARLDYAMRRAQANNSFIAAAPRFVIESAGMVMIVALAFWLSGKEGGLAGALPVLGALAIGAQKLLPQMQQVYSAWSMINGTRHQLHDVLALLQRPGPNSGALDTLQVKSESELRNSALGESTPLVAFSEVSFRYHPEGTAVLDQISFEIPRGARIGIVGQTGSGKSTLVDLLMGLLEPSDGQLLIDGEPLTIASRRAWQERIAHVPQAIFLSDASIAENIAFGIPKENIDLARVYEAARKAQLTPFIEALPEQFQTAVGERGVRLSGGQRQRIGLARALYKQADVLVLDEATSALDDATEREVMRELDALGNEITVFMIAHRLSTLARCDAILVLEARRGPRWVSYEELVSVPMPSSHSIQSAIETTHA